jgi:hypothetical protein
MLYVPLPKGSLTSRGNFKMNGSIKMIDSLVDQLNNAKLDGKTGQYPPT